MEKEVNVAVIHNQFRTIGGAEQVCVAMISALNSKGIVPDLYVPSLLEGGFKNAGFDYHIQYNHKRTKEVNWHKFTIYKTLTERLSFKVTGYDLNIDTGSSNLPARCSGNGRYVLYVHNPLSYMSIRPGRSSILWRVYRLPYSVTSKIALYRKIEIIANSEFTASRIKKLWGKKATVIYPPVPVHDYENEEIVKREGVTAIGRFGWSKRYDLLLKIAQQLPETTFKICGATAVQDQTAYYNEIKTLAKNMGLENVRFYTNLSRKDIIKEIKRSKYFIHLMKDEDFGIAVAEAIAGGCIPLVHNSGGPKEIVPFPEFRFDSDEEAHVKLKKIMETDCTKQMIILKERVKSFSFENFQQNILNYLGL